MKKNNSNNNSRIIWADYMKAFSIMAVVLFHTQIRPEIKTATYLVCLPAFFFVAGLFTNTQLSPKAFFLKKTLRLLIPYAIWGILTWIFWYFVSSRYGGSLENNIPWWKPLLGMVYGKRETLIHNAPLWFICCMVSLEWIYYLISRIPSQWMRWLIIICVSIIGCIASYWGERWVWGISAAFIILPIYAIGAEYHQSVKDQLAASARTYIHTYIHAYILIVILVCSCIGLWLGYVYNADIKLSDSTIGNPITYYITALSAVGLWLSISLYIENSHNWVIRLLQYIGQNTLFILCTHYPTFSIIKGIAFMCAIPLQFFETTVGSCVLWICTFIILLPLSYFVNRYCPILVGKLKTT